MSSRSVPTQRDKVKFSGSSVDHEAGELELRVVQWPDTGAPSLCCAASTILCYCCPLYCSHHHYYLSVLYDANNALEEWHYDPHTSVTLFYYWLVFSTQLLNNLCLLE